MNDDEMTRLIGEAIGEGMNKLIRQAYIDGEKSMRERAAELCRDRGLEGTARNILALPIKGESPAKGGDACDVARTQESSTENL